MSIFLIISLGSVLGWLAWNFAGEGGVRLAIYLLIGVSGALCAMLIMRYLGDPLNGPLGTVTLAPLCAFVLVSLVAFLDRKGMG